MDILLFKDLESLSKTGNFSQSAELSNLSQPAFSRRMKTLEEWVGTILIDRKRQPVRLTDAGQQILEAGLQALARVESARSQILEAQSLPDKYMIRFGAQHSIGWRFYPIWLQEFERAYGPILSRLRTDDLPNSMRDLKDGNIDFLIAYHGKYAKEFSEYSSSLWDRPIEKLESLIIGTDTLIPVCKPDVNGNALFDLTNQSVKMPYLSFGDHASIGKHLVPLFKEYELALRLNKVYENSMAGALRIRARAGDGIAWLPKSLVAPDLENGLLVATGQEYLKVNLEIRLLRNIDYINRLTQSIWSFLKIRQDSPLSTHG